jgi:hypothetical protein
MKPWPSHHKRVRVPFAAVANGYGGAHKFRGLPGTWQIIAADTETPPDELTPARDEHDRAHRGARVEQR